MLRLALRLLPGWRRGLTIYGCVWADCRVRRVDAEASDGPAGLRGAGRHFRRSSPLRNLTADSYRIAVV